MISHTQYDKCYSRNMCFFLRSDVFAHVCFSPCRQKRTIFLIPASMRYLYTIYAVYTRQILQLFAVIIVCLLLYTFTFQLRCWVALVRFHSSFCPSSVATGLRGPITSLQNRQKLTSHLVLPPISNWRQTAQLKYTGSISWGRCEEMQNNLVQMPKKNKKQAKHLVAAQKGRFYDRNYKCLLF